MRRKQLWPVLLFALVSLAGGCKAIDPGADPVIVTSQRTIRASYDTVHAFVRDDFQRDEIPSRTRDDQFCESDGAIVRGPHRRGNCAHSERLRS